MHWREPYFRRRNYGYSGHVVHPNNYGVPSDDPEVIPFSERAGNLGRRVVRWASDAFAQLGSVYFPIVPAVEQHAQATVQAGPVLGDFDEIRAQEFALALNELETPAALEAYLKRD